MLFLKKVKQYKIHKNQQIVTQISHNANYISTDYTSN